MVYFCNEKKDEDKFLVNITNLPNVLTFGFSREYALEMAKEALEACLEVDISRGYRIAPAVFPEGHPITVSSHIALSMQLRELRGEQSKTDIAQKPGLSYQAYQQLENTGKANPTEKIWKKSLMFTDRN